MNPYITFRDKDEEGNLQYYILQRDFPHFVGRIVYTPVEGAIANEPIAGYNMWVTFANTLRGNFLPSYKNIKDEINSVMFSMSAWFYSERILIDKDRFKKFKIK